MATGTMNTMGLIFVGVLGVVIGKGIISNSRSSPTPSNPSRPDPGPDPGPMPPTLPPGPGPIPPTLPPGPGPVLPPGPIGPIPPTTGPVFPGVGEQVDLDEIVIIEYDDPFQTMPSSMMNQDLSIGTYESPYDSLEG
jgi:hypothetical protein